MDKKHDFVQWFDQLEIADVPLVGGKNASLGEMYQHLTPKGVKLPNGFAVTAHAYHYFLARAGIRDRLRQTLEGLNTYDMDDLALRGRKARELILKADLPLALETAIIEAYDILCDQYGQDTDVAVRSSATAEDLPDASFAGQQETYLNICGHDQLLDACQALFCLSLHQPGHFIQAGQTF